jgi:plastocyanin
MKQPLLGTFAATAFATVLAGCGFTGPAHDQPSPQSAAAIEMGFSSFDPAIVTIEAGDTVEWQNVSWVSHTVTDDPTVAAVPHDAALPAGALAFDSGDIPAGEIYARVFTEPGTYRYFCRYHEDDGMVATIIVEPPF